MAKPKYDYDSESFYEMLQRFASVSILDKEIAICLNLAPDVFGAMKNGTYANWTKEENERRSERINRVLTRARALPNKNAWTAILKMGLGTKTTTVSVRANGEPCECGGKKNNCPYCGGTGFVAVEEGAIITKTVTEVPSSLQALSLWLHHHDANFRKVQRGEEPETNEVDGSDGSLSVDKWIEYEMKTDKSKDDEQ